MKNGYGEPIKNNNLDSIHTSKVKKAERRIEQLLGRLERIENGGTRPQRFTPSEIARVARAQARADRAGYALELRIGKLLDTINHETRKAIKRKK